jgi:hypothetical protein
MLPNNLTTNEVKDAAGSEVEYLRQSTDQRKLVFAKSGAAPNAPDTITVSHSEVGVGVKARRRSMLRVDLTADGASGVATTSSAYVVVDFPVGDSDDTTQFKATLARLISILASDGSDTSVKFDCTGTGADSLVNGTL